MSKLSSWPSHCYLWEEGWWVEWPTGQWQLQEMQQWVLGHCRFIDYEWIYPNEGLFTLDPRSEFSAHRMCIRCVHTWIRFGAMRIEWIHLWRWIGSEFEPNSLFIHRITIKSCMVIPLWTATLSKLYVWGHHTCCICRPRYELQCPIMLGRYWLDGVDKETTYQVVSCSSSKFTFHVVYFQRQDKTNNLTDFSVCFDKSRMLAW